jgi:hypothetical protein
MAVLAGVSETRAAIVEAAALEAARAWADASRAALVRDGRKIEGGWPGTLGEARAHAAARIAPALSKRSLPDLTHDELGRAARITYDEARRTWRAGAERP